MCSMGEDGASAALSIVSVSSSFALMHSRYVFQSVSRRLRREVIIRVSNVQHNIEQNAQVLLVQSQICR